MTISLLWIIGFSPFYVMLDSNSILNWTKFTASVSLFFFHSPSLISHETKNQHIKQKFSGMTIIQIVLIKYLRIYIQCTCHALLLSSFVFFLSEAFDCILHICISNIMFILLLASIKSVIHTLAKNINYYRHHYLFCIWPYKIGTNFIFHKQSNVFVHLHCFWFMARPTDRPTDRWFIISNDFASISYMVVWCVQSPLFLKRKYLNGFKTFCIGIINCIAERMMPLNLKKWFWNTKINDSWIAVYHSLFHVTKK